MIPSESHPLETAFGRDSKLIISNLARIAGIHFRGQLLWVLVKNLTSHGSAMSREICTRAGYDPDQTVGPKPLLPNVK